jgi:hypothetical protein
MMTEAHKQVVTHRYTILYPAHEPRKSDPHYVDFEAYRKAHVQTAVCAFALRTGDDSECDHDHPLELHHAHIEFALQNGVDLRLLERDYPGVSNPDEVGAWVESGQNLVFYCRAHHRGPGGVHSATSSDFEAEHYVRQLISAEATHTDNTGGTDHE